MEQIVIREHRGCRLTGRAQGEGAPVLLIQGVGVHGLGWQPQVAALEPRFRVLTFDNRGVGASQPVGAPITVEQMAEDARVLMDAAGFDSAHVVGHSLGGLVALQLALAAPGRVRSLALLCTFANGRDAAPPTPRMLALGMRTRLGTRAMRRRAFLELVMPPGSVRGADAPELAERFAPLFGHDLGESPSATGAQLAAMRAYDAGARLGELGKVPALVVSATHDPIAPPRAGRALADGLRESVYVELPDASHGVPIARPDQVNGLLLGHLARSEGRWSARTEVLT